MDKIYDPIAAGSEVANHLTLFGRAIGRFAHQFDCHQSATHLAMRNAGGTCVITIDVPASELTVNNDWSYRKRRRSLLFHLELLPPFSLLAPALDNVAHDHLRTDLGAGPVAKKVSSPSRLPGKSARSVEGFRSESECLLAENKVDKGGVGLGLIDGLTATISKNRESVSTALIPDGMRAQANNGSPLMIQKEKKTSDHESFSLTNHPFFLFNYVFLYRGRELSRELAKYDLDYPRWRVLSVLNEYPKCTMQVLADTVGVDRTSLTHTVRLMIDSGLLSKASRRSDRRSVSLSLTENGIDKFKKVLPIIVEYNEKCFADFSKEETEMFINFLRRVIVNIQGDAEKISEELDAVQGNIIGSIIQAK